MYIYVCIYIYIYKVVFSDPQCIQCAPVSLKQEGYHIYTIMKIMCTPFYHLNGFVVTHVVGHIIYSLCISIYLSIYLSISMCNIYIIYVCICIW